MRKINNKIIKSAVLVAFSVLLLACSDDFLNKQPNGGVISEDQLSEMTSWNSSVMLGFNTGISYTQLKSGTGGTDDHDDFGQKSIDIVTDLMSGDMAMSADSYGWFTDGARLRANLSTDSRAYKIWRYYYRIIKASNGVFDAVGGDEIAPTNPANRVYFGQAKANRAYSFFNLAMLYAPVGDYATNKNKPLIPIYRSQKVAVAQPLSSMDSVYSLIISDLKTAINCLDGYVRPVKSGKEFKFQIDKSVACGILAYVYLNMGDNTNAAYYADMAINTGQYSILPFSELRTTGFSDINANNWMWGIDLTKDNTAGLATFWGHVDYFTYSYAAAGAMKIIDANLQSEIVVNYPNDGRRGWFRASSPNLPWWKFYDSGREPMGDRQWENDEVMMRVEEMYLVSAEASARNNDLPTAKTVLKDLIVERYPAEEYAAMEASVDAMSQSQLLEFIYYNWRVEMWGEGKALQTMKRFKKTVTRGDNHYVLAGDAISYNDARLYFQIPQNEIANNPHLK